LLVTTQTNAWAAVYSVTDRVSILGLVPWVWTRASQGVLQGQSGMQDFTIGGKYAVIERSSAKYGALRAIVAMSGSLPLSSYTPDFAPLSIGTHSQRIAPRVTLNYQTDTGIYLEGTTAFRRIRRQVVRRDERPDAGIGRPVRLWCEQIATPLVRPRRRLNGIVAPNGGCAGPKRAGRGIRHGSTATEWIGIAPTRGYSPVYGTP